MGLLVVYQVVNRAFVKPLAELNQNIAKQRRELAKYKRLPMLEAKYKRRWRELAHRALGRDAPTVQARFGDEITKLLKASGLTHWSCRPTPPKPLERKSKLQRVSFMVSAEGSLKNVVEFLRRFYERPFLARISSLSLDPKGGRSGAGLKMNARLETLVLPEMPQVGRVAVLSTNPSSQPTRKRYAADDPQAYAMIWQKELLSRYEPPKPPPPVAKKNNKKPPAGGNKPARPPRSRTDSRSAIVVMAVASYPGVQEVVTYNTKTKQETVYRVGDPTKDRMDDGRLVLVHPLGAVVRKGQTDYFYPVGSTFAEASPVDAKTHAVIYEALAAMRKK